jgi:hypothetical protein
LRLRTAKQLLKPRGIFEPLFEGFRTFLGVRRVRRAFHPIALLLVSQKLAQAFDPVSITADKHAIVRRRYLF